jgi:hypothetical protein
MVDVVWQLVREGLVRPGKANPSALDPTSFHLPYYCVPARRTPT